jgi:hypothetical protein
MRMRGGRAESESGATITQRGRPRHSAERPRSPCLSTAPTAPPRGLGAAGSHSIPAASWGQPLVGHKRHSDYPGRVGRLTAPVPHRSRGVPTSVGALGARLPGAPTQHPAGQASTVLVGFVTQQSGGGEVCRARRGDESNSRYQSSGQQRGSDGSSDRTAAATPPRACPYANRRPAKANGRLALVSSRDRAPTRTRGPGRKCCPRHREGPDLE